MARDEKVTHSRESGIPFDLFNILGKAFGMMHYKCNITYPNGRTSEGCGDSQGEAYRNAQLKREEVHKKKYKAPAKISEKKAERTIIREERQRKYVDWHERMEGHIQRWKINIEKAGRYISGLENQINRLEDEVSNARTDEYADRVRGWIEEKYQKIDDVKRQIQELEDKISSVKGKLR